MKHAPATMKGLARRWAVKVIELIIGAGIIYGSLYLICFGINRLLCAGVG